MDLTGAINSSLAFLNRGFEKYGHWKEFETLAGKSDLWVTAYIGCNICEGNTIVGLDLAQKAWRYIQRNRWGFARTKWGFNRHVPSDADSTAWSILLANMLGVKTAAVERAKKFLRLHMLSNGGIATYRRSAPIRAFTRLDKKISFDGWCRDHPCVTAAFMGIPDLVSDQVLNYALARQHLDGCWSSYWWTSNAYTTATMAENLYKYRSSDRRSVIDDSIVRSIAWASNLVATRQKFDPFELSFLIRILCVDPKAGSEVLIDRAVKDLLAHQLYDGSWPSAACLQIPPPDVTDPTLYNRWMVNGRGGGSHIFDSSRTFTTASVVNALNKVKCRWQ